MYAGRTRTYRMLTGASEGKGKTEDLGVDGKIILKLIFKK
jgi:hypothetical protein